MSIISKFVHLPQLGKLVTSAGVRDKQVYNWYYFPHSFSPEIIDFLLNRYNKNVLGVRLLDPFSGSGTAVLRGTELGLDGVGIDIMPFSIDVGKAKTFSYKEEDIIEIRREYNSITKKFRNDYNYSTDLSFVDKVFNKEVSAYLIYLSKEIGLSSYKSFFVTWLAKFTSSVSGSTKSGGFTRNASSSRKISSKSEGIPAAKDINDAINIGNGIFEEMIYSCSSINIKGEAQFILGDSREVHKILVNHEKFDIVITSPPYPNRQDYTRIFAEELFSTYSTNDIDHKNLRYSTLRSHLEARSPERLSEEFYIPEKLSVILDKIEEDLLISHQEYENLKQQSIPNYKIKRIDNRVPRMIRGYFEDQYILLESIKKVTKPGAEVCIIVANVKHSGKTIECDSIIGEIGEICNFDHVETIIARYKGNSSQQMKFLERTPLRESVVVLRRKND